MRGAVAAWIVFRGLRWLLYLGWLGYCLAFVLDRSSHLNSFGQLLRETEFWMFVLPQAAVVAGLFELMMREWAGLPPPEFGRNWTSAPSAPAMSSKPTSTGIPR